MDRLYQILGVIFGKDDADNGLDLCDFLPTVLNFEYITDNSARDRVYNLSNSVYRKQYDASLVTALKNAGITHVTYDPSTGMLTTSDKAGQ